MSLRQSFSVIILQESFQAQGAEAAPAATAGLWVRAREIARGALLQVDLEEHREDPRAELLAGRGGAFPEGSEEAASADRETEHSPCTRVPRDTYGRNTVSAECLAVGSEWPQS